MAVVITLVAGSVLAIAEVCHVGGGHGPSALGEARVVVAPDHGIPRSAVAEARADEARATRGESAVPARQAGL